MKQDKLLRQINKARQDLEAIILDMSEIKALGDIEFQTKRIKKVADDLGNAGTLIHGSGTGTH
jgi:hypothetical protein